MARALSRMRVGEGPLRTRLLRVNRWLPVGLLALWLWQSLLLWRVLPSSGHQRAWIIWAIVVGYLAQIVILHITELEPPKSEPKPLLNLSA